jgi:hypothetical protein
MNDMTMTTTGETHRAGRSALDAIEADLGLGAKPSAMTLLMRLLDRGNALAETIDGDLALHVKQVLDIRPAEWRAPYHSGAGGAINDLGRAMATLNARLDRIAATVSELRKIA